MTRIDIFAEKGTEEVLDQAFYALAGGLWIEEQADGVRITCYPADPVGLRAYFGASGLPVRSITTTEEKEKDYAALVRRQFTPVRVGGLTILPPWRKRRCPGRTIVIEPGMAFGTGRHESTKLMLGMMSRLDLAGRRVLDIGSGSGILAVNAALLGASLVVAVDHDPLAARAMKKACDLNGTRAVLLACCGVEALKGAFDVVLANLDFATFSRLSGQIVQKTAPGGFLVVSGIEEQRAGRAAPLFEPLTLVSRRRLGEWRGFVFKARPPGSSPIPRQIDKPAAGV